MFIEDLEILLGLKSWLRDFPLFFGVQSLEEGQKHGNKKKYYRCYDKILFKVQWRHKGIKDSPKKSGGDFIKKEMSAWIVLKTKKEVFPGTVEGGIKLLTGNTNSEKSLCKGWVHEKTWVVQ